MQMPDSISRYMSLARDRPDLFAPSEAIPLVLDAQRMLDFSEKTGNVMGLVYDNSPFYLVVADLCMDEHGPYSYARVLYPNSTNGSTALVHRTDGKFALLRTFRHAPRTELWEIPRGFAEHGLTAEETIRNELSEEMHASVLSITYIGSIHANSGLASGIDQVYLAEVDFAEANIGHEGIQALLWLNEDELLQAIAQGHVTDSYTLSALQLYNARKISHKN